MSLDRSLRSKSTLSRHRNVLSRPERIARMKDLEKWQDSMSVLGLPKISNRKPKAGKKKVKEEAATEGAAAAAPGATPPAGAAAAAAKAPAGAKPDAAKKDAGPKKDEKKK